MVQLVNAFHRYVEARALNEGQPPVTADEVIPATKGECVMLK